MNPFRLVSIASSVLLSVALSSFPAVSAALEGDDPAGVVDSGVPDEGAAHDHRHAHAGGGDDGGAHEDGHGHGHRHAQAGGGDDGAHGHADGASFIDPHVLDGHGHPHAVAGVDGGPTGFLFPQLHAFGAFGDTTGDQADLAVNGHDPQTDATLQSLEPAVALRAGRLSGFVSAAGVTDADGDFTFELEEGFLRVVGLPHGLSVRGGQFFNRFGFQNHLHNHAWRFVDQNLVNGRFLNEGELTTQGGEVSWEVPLPLAQASRIAAAVGGLPAHGHGGGHGHEGEEEHGGAEFEAEGADFVDRVVSVDWMSRYEIAPTRWVTTTLSGAWGDNRFGRQSQVYGAGFEYLWRERGSDPGGRSLRWRTEALIRDVDAVAGALPGEGGHEEEEGHHGHHGHHGEEEGHDGHGEEERHGRAGSFDEFGLYSMVVYGWNDRLEAGVRTGWVSGIDELGLDDRVRISPVVSWFANPQRTVQARLQYNWDHSDEFGSESSIWFQLGFNFGQHRH